MSRAKVNGVKTENSTMWYVDFTDDQLASARGLVFFFEPSAFDSSADNYRSYVADIASGDPAEFIYCADGTDAVRSYLAFGQYEAGCAAPVTKLCLAGSVTGSDGSAQGYEFKPLYQISDGSEIIGSSEGASGDVLAIGGFDSEGTATLGIRTLYTDNYAEAGKTPTGLTFRTPVSRTTVGGSLEFPQPVAEIVNRCFSPGSVNTLDDPDLNARTYTLGAYAEVKVTAPEAEGMIWYADFRLAAEGDSYHVSHPERANGGEVVHKAHTAATAVPGAMSIDYNPWAEGDTYSEANNWSAKLAASEVWPLNLPDVVEVKREYKYGNDWQFDEAEPKASVSGSVRAVYPVVVETVPSVMTVGPSPAAAPVRRAPRADEPFYKLLLKSGEPVNVTLSLNGGDLTAVRDIVAPETAGAEVEYYNLHGVRMSGALAPGVYIRRCGSAARKVVVR